MQCYDNGLFLPTPEIIECVCLETLITSYLLTFRLRYDHSNWNADALNLLILVILNYFSMELTRKYLRFGNDNNNDR